jgi:hypothetical protein
MWSALVEALKWFVSERRSLKVTTSRSSIPPSFEPHILVTTVNTGHRRVTVNMHGIEIDGHLHWLGFDLNSYSERPVPYALDDGDRNLFWIPLAVLARDLPRLGYSGAITVRGCVSDTTGTTHKGKAITLSPDELVGEE